MAVLQACCDESGTDAASAWINISGWVAERPAWKQLTTGWRRVLARGGPKPVREAKAADMEAREGDFAGWTDREMDTFRWKLGQRIQDRVRFGVSISVLKADYERVVIPHLPKFTEHQFGAFRDPYVWLMASAVGLVMSSGHLKPDERVHFIFDKGHAGQGKAEEFFLWMHDAMRKGDPELVARIVRNFGRADSCEFPPLQAADQLAWGCNRGERLEKITGSGFIEMDGVIGVHRPIVGGRYTAEGLETALFQTGSSGARWPLRGHRRIETEFAP